MKENLMKRTASIFMILVLSTIAFAAINHNRQMNRGAELSHAVSASDIVKVQFLLKQGYDPDAEGYKGGKPIYWASFRGNRQMLELLIRSGANVSGSEGVRALIVAVDKGDISTVNTLLKYGANPNTIGPYGETAVESARKRNMPKILEILRSHTESNP